MNENKYVIPVFSVIIGFGVLFVLHYFYSNLDAIYDAYSLTSTNEFWSNSKLRMHASQSPELQSSIFPHMVHQMWKSDSLPPRETMRWRSSCRALNPFHNFTMSNDQALRSLVEIHYPQYKPLFDALSGVCKFSLPTPLFVLILFAL